MRSPFIVVANPGSKRLSLFQQALVELNVPPARVAAWRDLLEQRIELRDLVQLGDVVRLESPGQDFEVERAILAAGAHAPDEDGDYERIAPEDIAQLHLDKGRILAPRQWYLGFRTLLHGVACQLAACPPHRRMSDPAEIAGMFDKRACHAAMHAAGIPVPPGIGPVCCFEELVERMRQTGIGRAFVKLAHGSSASGAVAYQTNGHRHQATSTVEMVRREGTLVLYNSRRIRVYDQPNEIAALIDALCRHRVHVEQWLPKAAYGNRAFDIRVVVIAGQAQHAVVRTSAAPMTNLHLGNVRGEVGSVQDRMGLSAWAAAVATCERVMTQFPASLHGGVDMLIAPDCRRHAILEVNAFGDLLPGVVHNGHDTYAAEILAMQDWKPYPKPEGKSVATIAHRLAMDSRP